MIGSKIWDQIIFLAYAGLFFFVPLILTPWNYELFEFNKMVTVYGLTIIIVWAWLAKMITNQQFIFRRSFWDLPLIIFFLSQAISTLVSIDRHTSIFGYYSRFHGGLLSTICYLLLYWAFVSNIKSTQKKRLIKVALASGGLVALYGIAEHFGIDKNIWVQDVQNRVFSTLGQPNWLAAYLDILIFIVLIQIISSPKPLPSILYTLYSILYLCLLYTKSRSGFLGFIIPFLIFLTKKFIQSIRNKGKKGKELRKKLLLISSLVIVLSWLVGIPFQLRDLRAKINLSFLSDVQETKKPTVSMTNEQMTKLKITPSSDIRKIVWKGALALWRRYPLFGTGVETFAYSYYWVRPREHNDTSEWDFLYNKAHNELLNFAATTGTFGLVSYLILAVSPIIYSLRKKSSNSLNAIHYPLASLLITNFFGFSVVPVALFFFLLPGFLVDSTAPNFPQNKSIKTNQPLLIGLSLIALFLIIKVINYWRADFYFARGRDWEKMGYLNKSLQNLSQALKLNPNEPLFWSHRSVVEAKLVAALHQKQPQAEPDVRLRQLTQQAVADSRKALTYSPFHLNYYKNQAKMYYYLSFLEIDYLRRALETLLQAQKLAPTDPKIAYNIGLIYQAFNDHDRAQEFLRRALELKPDYQAAQKALEQTKALKENQPNEPTTDRE